MTRCLIAARGVIKLGRGLNKYFKRKFWKRVRGLAKLNLRDRTVSRENLIA